MSNPLLQFKLKPSSPPPPSSLLSLSALRSSGEWLNSSCCPSPRANSVRLQLDSLLCVPSVSSALDSGYLTPLIRAQLSTSVLRAKTRQNSENMSLLKAFAEEVGTQYAKVALAVCKAQHAQQEGQEPPRESSLLARIHALENGAAGAGRKRGAQVLGVIEQVRKEVEGGMVQEIVKEEMAGMVKALLARVDLLEKERIQTKEMFTNNIISNLNERTKNIVNENADFIKQLGLMQKKIAKSTANVDYEEELAKLNLMKQRFEEMNTIRLSNFKNIEELSDHLNNFPSKLDALRKNISTPKTTNPTSPVNISPLMKNSKEMMISTEEASTSLDTLSYEIDIIKEDLFRQRRLQGEYFGKIKTIEERLSGSQQEQALEVDQKKFDHGAIKSVKTSESFSNDSQITINLDDEDDEESITYQIDEEGFLLDGEGYPILDSEGYPKKLSQEEIEEYKAQGLYSE